MPTTWREEARSLNFRQGVIGEFVASFLLLFMTVGVLVFSQDREGIAVENATQIAILVGVTVTILCFIFGPISGAHFNCVFSFMAALIGKVSWFRCACYSIAQVLGMIAGTLYVKLLSPDLFARIDAANRVQPGFTTLQALGMEVWVTVMVFSTTLACMDSYRHTIKGGQQFVPIIGPLVVGTAVTTALFVGIPVSSACLNTSRALAVALVTGDWDGGRFWVFVVGPYLGALTISIPYMLLFSERRWLVEWLDRSLHAPAGWVAKTDDSSSSAAQATEAEAAKILAPIREAMRQVEAAEGAMTNRALATAPSAFGLKHSSSGGSHASNHSGSRTSVAAHGPTSVASFGSPLQAVADVDDDNAFDDDEGDDDADGSPSPMKAAAPAGRVRTLRRVAGQPSAGSGTVDDASVRALSVHESSSFTLSLSPPQSSTAADARWHIEGDTAKRALVKAPSLAMVNAPGAVDSNSNPQRGANQPETSPW